LLRDQELGHTDKVDVTVESSFPFGGDGAPQVFVPAGESVGMDVELVQGSADRVIDDLLDGFWPRVKAGTGRKIMPPASVTVVMSCRAVGPAGANQLLSRARAVAVH
jgi:hypothetical protein